MRGVSWKAWIGADNARELGCERPGSDRAGWRCLYAGVTTGGGVAAPVGTPVTEVGVHTFANWLQASVWAERLRAEGIPVVLSAIGPGVGRFGTDQLAPHELRVRSTDLIRARELLEADSGPTDQPPS